MSEAKRQLGIKTRSVKRLAADVKSYLVEKAAHQTKLDTALASSSTEAGDVKRAREFVEEADATILDVRQRLDEAYVVLKTFTEDLQQEGQAEVLEDQSFLDAKKMLEDIAPLVTVAGDQYKERSFKITVYGGSQLSEDDDLWRPIESLGEQLSQAGYHLLTGGYSGTSEAISFGASHVPNAKIEGIICESAFPSRPLPNQYINIETKATDLNDRANQLIKSADAFIVLPGSLGTLSKFFSTWNLSAAGSCQEQPPLTILVWKNPWQQVIESLAATLKIPHHILDVLKYVESAEEVLTELDAMKRRHRLGKVGVQAGASSTSASSTTTTSSSTAANTNQ